MDSTLVEELQMFHLFRKFYIGSFTIGNSSMNIMNDFNDYIDYNLHRLKLKN
jgi:hypothetical protein